MDTILNFLADNYKWFMGGAIVLLIALIGFIVDGKKKKKNEELPESTATINQVDAANQSQNVVPTQEVEQSLVFEQPSLNDNDTMSELKESGVEPSLTFESNSVETPMSNYTGNAEQVVNDTVAVNNNTIGETVATPDMVYSPVEQPVVVETPVYTTPVEPFVMNEAPVMPIVETPVVETPAVEVPFMGTPVMPSPVETPMVETPAVETPVVTVPAIETPTVNVNPTNNNTQM